uniref:Uncharacterized protein n=1 Tax=Rhizophora mucronata TaxID=61149 RepID=A0A2P2PL83_RHIMU
MPHIYLISSDALTLVNNAFTMNILLALSRMPSICYLGVLS